MPLTCVREAANLVSDRDLKVAIKASTFDRKYLNALVSKFLVLKIKTIVAYLGSWPKYCFPAELTPQKTKCKSN